MQSDQILCWSHVSSRASWPSRGINENPCHTWWMYRLIWVFAGHTGLTVNFVVPWIIQFQGEMSNNMEKIELQHMHSNRYGTFFIRKMLISYFSTKTYVVGLAEALLISTHNMFLWRNKKILCGYPLLSVAMTCIQEDSTQPAHPLSLHCLHKKTCTLDN